MMWVKSSSARRSSVADPVLRVAVAHEGRPADDGVARDDDLFLRQVDEHIPLGVGAPEVEEVDLPVAAVELHRPLEGHGGERGLERRHLGEVGLGVRQVGLEPRAISGGRGRGEVGLELGDLAGHLADVVLDALEPLPHHRLARELVGDDLRVGVGGGVDLVAVPVVPVEVRVDDVADGLLRDVAAARSTITRAAEGLECVSTMTTPSSLSMIAVLQFTL